MRSVLVKKERKKKEPTNACQEGVGGATLSCSVHAKFVARMASSGTSKTLVFKVEIKEYRSSRWKKVRLILQLAR